MFSFSLLAISPYILGFTYNYSPTFDIFTILNKKAPVSDWLCLCAKDIWWLLLELALDIGRDVYSNTTPLFCLIS